MLHFESGPDRHVVGLNRAHPDRALVGGKAAMLAHIAGFGAPVAAAFALTVYAYADFAAVHGFPITAADVRLEELSKLRSTMLGAPLPDAVAGSLQRAFEEFQLLLGNGLSLSVRPSPTGEEFADYSSPGIHDTVLDVRSLAGLEVAVKQCWASRWSDRAVSWPMAHGLGSGNVEIAVVVQHLVRCDVSFCANTEDRDHVVIRATWGLREAAVSGRVVPDHIVVSRNDEEDIQYTVGAKTRMVIAGDTQHVGTRVVPVPRSLQTVPALEPDEVHRILHVAGDLSQRLGCSLELEGGIADGAMHLFGARLIAGPGGKPAVVRPSASSASIVERA